MRRKRVSLICLALAAALVLGGCRGTAREADEVAFVVAVGVDKAADKQLAVSYQIGRAGGGADSSGDGSAMGQEPMSEVVTITAPSLAEARNLLNSVLAPAPSLSHVKVLVIGEELARHGLQDTLGALVRYREFRGSMFVVVCRGQARDFLLANRPLFTFSIAKYYELMMSTAAETGYFADSQLHDFYLRMKSHSGEAYAAYGAVSPRTGQGVEEPGVTGEKMFEAKAGGLARRGGNAPEFLGTAVFKGDRMVGILDSHGTRALEILLDRYPRGFLTVEDPLEPERGVNVNVGLDEKPKIRARLEEGRPVFDISVNLEGEISAIPSGINYERVAYRKLLERQVSDVFTEELRKYFRETQAMNADPAGLGYRLRPCFSTRRDFHAYNWNDKYRTAQINISVKTTLRRTGLMWRSSPIVRGHGE